MEYSTGFFQDNDIIFYFCVIISRLILVRLNYESTAPEGDALGDVNVLDKEMHLINEVGRPDDDDKIPAI